MTRWMFIFNCATSFVSRRLKYLKLKYLKQFKRSLLEPGSVLQIAPLCSAIYHNDFACNRVMNLIEAVSKDTLSSNCPIRHSRHARRAIGLSMPDDSCRACATIIVTRPLDCALHYHSNQRLIHKNTGNQRIFTRTVDRENTVSSLLHRLTQRIIK